MSGEVMSPPGSDDAVNAGCTCARMDNGYGRGAMGSTPGNRLFWISGDCPLHAPAPQKEKADG